MLEICECQFVALVVENWGSWVLISSKGIFFSIDQPLISSAGNEGRDCKDRVFREVMNDWNNHYGGWES